MPQRTGLTARTVAQTTRDPLDVSPDPLHSPVESREGLADRAPAVIEVAPLLERHLPH